MYYKIKLTDRTQIKPLKISLEKSNLLDKSQKISQQDGTITIPTLIQDLYTFKKLGISQYNCTYELGNEVKDRITLDTILLSFIKDEDLIVSGEYINDLVSALPKRYSIYPPMILLQSNTLDTQIWNAFQSTLSDSQREKLFASFIIDFFQKKSNEVLTHIAINKPITENLNEIRYPTDLVQLYGNFGLVEKNNFESEFWCHTVQNSIYQTWAPRFTMFSRGNIKEKKRILDTFTNIKDNYIIDLYSGIGYFTFCYLDKGAKKVLCWEINEWSCEGMIKGYVKNKFGSSKDYYIIKKDETINIQKFNESKLVIFNESNEFAIDRLKQLNFLVPISHINLGLLPSSKKAWPISLELIRCFSSLDSVFIHIHENVGKTNLDNFLEKAKRQLEEKENRLNITPIHLEKVKTFAPDVFHIVADFKISKL